MPYEIIITYDEDGSEGLDGIFKTKKEALARIEEIKKEHEEHGEKAKIEIIKTNNHYFKVSF